MNGRWMGLGALVTAIGLAALPAKREYEVRSRARVEFEDLLRAQDFPYKLHFKGDHAVSLNGARPQWSSHVDLLHYQMIDHDKDGDLDVLVIVPRKGIYLLENITRPSGVAVSARDPYPYSYQDRS